MCKKERPVTDFRWQVKAKGLRISRCRPCDKTYRKTYHKANRDHILRRNQKSDERRVARVVAGEVKLPERKSCLECGEEKSITEFRSANTARAYTKPRCLECDKSERSRRYKANPSQYVENNKRNYAKLKAIVQGVKTGRACADCGEVFPPYVLDFDHRDPSTKLAKVSALVFSGSKELLLAEIEKCDLVCSNCHRKRTHERRMSNGTGSA